MRRHTVLWTLVLCLTTAVVTSASAAPREATITLAVRPSLAALQQPFNLSGTISSGEARGVVTVQFKECGVFPIQFRDTAEMPATVGEWATSTVTAASGTFRATLGTSVSNEVRVRTRAYVRLAQTGPRRYVTYVDARQSFWRKRVRIERYDRRRSRWMPLRTIVLAHAGAAGFSNIPTVRSKSDRFVLRVPAGTKLRAAFPLAQAKPCYAAGYSLVLQT